MIRGLAFTLLIEHPLIPIDASRRAYRAARVRSLRIEPLSKKIDLPAYPRSIVPSGLSHSLTQRIGAEGVSESSRVERSFCCAIRSTSENVPYSTPRWLAPMINQYFRPRWRTVFSQKPSADGTCARFKSGNSG